MAPHVSDQPPALLSHSVRNIILVWLGWTLILLGFQAWTVMRFQVKHPDYALEWTPIDTALTYKLHKPYLNEPFMNQQVAFDSEYYLSIATAGYDDPKVTSAVIDGQRTPLNYAFLPFYPLVMRAVAFPLKVLSLTPIATSTLAGVIVSALGTLGGMLALFDLARQELGERGAWRSVFYLLVFPAGFFLVMVYTEGLFVGLAFGSLALLQRKHFLPAALLAICATLTRAVGVALVIPLVIAYVRSQGWRQIRLTSKGIQQLGLAAFMLTPLIAYAIWRFSPLGTTFQLVEENYFGRHFLGLEASLKGWANILSLLGGGNSQTTAYYLLEIGATLLAFLACIFTYKRYPEVTLFSLAVIVISFTSGYPQGMHRYVMTAPALFLFLGRLGKHPAFDRSWIIMSSLLMGSLALLFAADMWAG
jgi:Gpi18-like mannosyltransferase